MSHSLIDLQRLVPELFTEDVKEALPEFFTEDNEKLVNLLEEYYDWMDSSTQFNFPDLIRGITMSRDIQSANTKYLDQIIAEIGNGLTQSSFFDNPRLMTSLLSRFYRVKGSLSSVEGFFRGFFGEEVNVEYPKNNMFIVGESEIGYESLKFIQNNALYQIFSI